MKSNIIIHQGVGDVRFGMPIEDVVRLLGEADEVETIDNIADEPTTLLRYSDGMTIFCEGANPSVSCIDIADDGATLFGKSLFAMEEKEIVRLLVENNFFEQDADEEDWGERRISFPEANIDFYFEEGELTSVILGC